MRSHVLDSDDRVLTKLTAFYHLRWPGHLLALRAPCQPSRALSHLVARAERSDAVT